ncbi:energy-coupling factor transporter ATPase [Tepidanaerobacter syntrophicus]|uniref:energy-coupling factor transporter ATPase n=1 Tax=Tepidanaerobacter syntrophicus TaxID=224999 RepID=UPI001BD44540|nr:energy-coupling factor transporter ATPase [Tepidanaerobacter syntrophicus]
MESYTIKNLTFSYPQQEKKILKNLSCSIEQGQFIVLCGPSGCGKTTLLRQLKTVLTPHGIRSGEILFEGLPLSSVDQYTQSSKIGFVMQSPDNQIVTDKVWHELAFGLESLGFDTLSIRRRVAEMASFFGIQNWFYKNVTELSGGQKQLLNLASIMAMQPSVLILDEPTGQLDPIAAGDFLTTVSRINRELGVTVIMTEHRLEEVLPFSDRVLVLDEGQFICDGVPEEVGRQLKKRSHSMFLAMPVPMRIYAGVENDLPCPITVREGRVWLDSYAREHTLGEVPMPNIPPYELKCTPAIEFKEVWFRYEKDAPDVLKGLSMKVFPGEFYAILGGNGTGKTTALSLIPGINKPYRGKVMLNGQDLSKIGDRQLFSEMLGVLPQNPQALFVKKTVREDLLEMLSGQKLSKEEKTVKIRGISKLCRLDDLLEMHPYDLSGGEQQRAALAKVLLLEPKILILDEPTKGLDSEFKQVFAEILYKLLHKGVTITMVSHDIEFCAKYAHRCALFFDGNIVSSDEPQRFFSGNNFYTTAANRMARHKLPNAITAEDVIIACGGDVKHFEIKKPEKDNTPEEPLQKDFKDPLKKSKSTPYRKMKLAFAALALIAAGVMAVGGIDDLSGLMYGGFMATEQLSDSTIWRYVIAVLTLSLGLGVLFEVLRRPRPTIENEQTAIDERYLPKRTLAAMAMILFAIPLTIYIGVYYLYDRKYYFISMLIILESMLPFVMIFERRKPQARELIVIAVLCAIGVAGRTAFFMLPQFKPVAAIVIISGVAFGGEAGFIVGAVTGFVSNMFFGQGPWTPWQMFAFGIIGFLAGVLFRKGLLRRNTIALCIFGGLATFFIYGGIMNPASVIMFQSHPTKEMFFMAYLRGIPFDLVHATATVVFLWLTAQPMLEKLDRIKVKYGLIEPSDEILKFG